jgi:hypothetical protein
MDFSVVDQKQTIIFSVVQLSGYQAYQKGVEYTELMLKWWIPLVISSVLRISTNIDTVDTPLNLSFTKDDSLM